MSADGNAVLHRRGGRGAPSLMGSGDLRLEEGHEGGEPARHRMHHPSPSVQTLALGPGVPTETADGDEPHLSDLSLTVDDPHGFVDAARARIVLTPHDPGPSRE